MLAFVVQARESTSTSRGTHTIFCAASVSTSALPTVPAHATAFAPARALARQNSRSSTMHAWPIVGHGRKRKQKRNCMLAARKNDAESFPTVLLHDSTSCVVLLSFSCSCGMRAPCDILPASAHASESTTGAEKASQRQHCRKSLAKSAPHCAYRAEAGLASHGSSLGSLLPAKVTHANPSSLGLLLATAGANRRRAVATAARTKLPMLMIKAEILMPSTTS